MRGWWRGADGPDFWTGLEQECGSTVGPAPFWFGSARTMRCSARCADGNTWTNVAFGQWRAVAAARRDSNAYIVFRVSDAVDSVSSAVKTRFLKIFKRYPVLQLFFLCTWT